MFGHPNLVKYTSVIMSNIFWNYFQLTDCNTLEGEGGTSQLVYHTEKKKCPQGQKLNFSLVFFTNTYLDHKRRVGIASKPYFKVCVL